MKLAELLELMPSHDFDSVAFPRDLLGAFRRKSITFCTGVTDERSVVFWFQSRTFTIDLRLPDGAATPLLERQGWLGDTQWDEQTRQMSWSVRTSFQPRNQWPEPASFSFIGNCVLEFAPSGAYVEDWRQQCSRGPLVGLRLVSMLDETTGQTMPMDGGLILAGEHAAYTQSRLPDLEQTIRNAGSLQRALEDQAATQREIESYEVSVALGGAAITHSTRSEQLGQQVTSGEWAIDHDGSITLAKPVDGMPCRLRFALDLCQKDVTFGRETTATSQAREWMQRERDHLARHAVVAH